MCAGLQEDPSHVAFCWFNTNGIYARTAFSLSEEQGLFTIFHRACIEEAQAQLEPGRPLCMLSDCYAPCCVASLHVCQSVCAVPLCAGDKLAVVISLRHVHHVWV